MRLAIRRLPLRIPPADGESFASYVDRLAYDMDTPLIALLHAIGLIDDEHDKAIGAGYGIALSSERLTRVATTLDLSEQRISQLFLSHYQGVAVDVTDFDPDERASVAKVAFREWAYFSGSHLCPACLSESGGVWQLKWKLPWSFACIRHDTLLADTCPQCERRIGMARQDGSSRPRFISRVPKPGYCSNAQPPGIAATGLAAMPCGQPLTEIAVEPLQNYRRLLVAQETIDRILETSSVTVGGEEVATLEYFRTLRSLCALQLYAAKVLDLGTLPRTVADSFGSYVADRDSRAEDRERIRLSGGDFRSGRRTRYYIGAPKSVQLMAAVVTVAVEMLGTGDASDTDLLDKVTWLFERTSERDRRALDMLPGYFSFSPHLKRVFDQWRLPTRSFTTKLQTSASTDSVSSTPALNVNHVPQLLWDECYQEMFADLIVGVRAENVRRVCSMSLVRLTGDYTWKEAAEALELPVKEGYGMANKVVSLLNSTDNTDMFTSRLQELAQRIASDPERIDYGLRRRVLADLNDITPEDWKAICEEAEVYTGKRGGKSRYAATWLWSHLTEGDYRLSPGFIEKDGESQREMYRRFVKNDLKPLQIVLFKYGLSRVSKA